MITVVAFRLQHSIDRRTLDMRILVYILSARLFAPTIRHVAIYTHR